MADLLSDSDVGLLSDDQVGIGAPQQSSKQLMSDADVGLLSDDQVGLGTPRPQPEGKFKSGFREAMHGIVPTIGGMLGAGAGALAGAPGGPAAFAGGVAGMFAGAAGGAALEHAALDAIGFNDDAQRAANAEENPISTFAGGMAPAVATLNPFRAASVGERAMAGGLGAAFEGGQELYQDGSIDPKKVAASAAIFAAAPHTNAAGDILMGAGQKAAQRVGKMVNHSAAQTTASGTAMEHAPPVETDADEIGNPQSRSTGSSRKYPVQPENAAPQQDMLSFGDMDPATVAALEKSLNANTTKPQGPLPNLPKEGPDLKNMKYPGEKLPMDTKTSGFDEQIAKQQAAIQARQAELAAQPPAAAEAIATSKSRGRKPKVEVQPTEAIVSQGEPVDKAEISPETANIDGLAEGRKPETGNLLSDEDVGVKQHPADMIEEAAKDTDNAATPDQKRAGNYKKGGGSGDRMFGRMIKVETPKGEVRRSHPEDDVQWEVKSPADYGYFRGTAGADSKPGKPEGVDFYNVGNGDNHYVIDQRNPETGKFDEHKVMANAKDPASAIDVYNRGFSDGRGPERLGAITKISDEEAAKWLGTPGRKKDPYSKLFEEVKPAPTEEAPSRGVTVLPDKTLATYTPRKGVEPKIVKMAVEKMTAAGLDPEHIEAFRAMEPSKRLAEANRYVNESDKPGVRPNRVRGKEKAPVIEGILNDQGKPVTTGTKEEAASKSADVAKMNDAYQRLFSEDDVKMLPSSGDTDTATRNYLKDRLQDYLDETKDVVYKPNFKHEPYLLERAAKQLLKTKNPSPDKWKEFANTVRLLRGGGADIVRQGARVEGDIAHNARSGDAAIARGEAEGARANNIEDQVASKIDDDRREWLAKNYEGREPYIDVPHEEAERMVEPKPIKDRKDWRSVETGDKELDLAKPEDRAQMQNDTAVLAANIMREGQKNRKPPAKSSEDIKTTEVRRPKLDSVNMEELKASIAKAEARNKRFNPDAVKDEELGRFDPEPPTKKDLVDRINQAGKGFLLDEGGSLNYQKIHQDYRVHVLPQLKRLAASLRKDASAFFGYRATNRQVKIDALGRHAISEYMRTLAQHAELMDGKFEAWTNLSKKNQVDFQKLLEAHKDKAVNAKKFEQDLINKYQVKPADAKWMAEDAPIWRDILQGVWQQDKLRGIDIGYLRGYMAHIFVNDHGAAEWIANKLQPLGARWYTKTRLFDTILEAEKAGFKLKFENPVDMLNARMNASFKNHMLLDFANSLKENGYAIPTKDASAIQKRIWKKKVGLADGQEWLLAPDAEAVFHNGFVAEGLQGDKGKLGSIYRALMRVKTVMMPIQLGISLFHAGHILSISAAENLDRAFANWMAPNGKFIDSYKTAFRDIGRDGLLALPLDKIKWLGSTKLGQAAKNFEGRQIMEDWKKPPDQLPRINKMVSQMFAEAGTSPHQAREDVIGAKRDFTEAIANWRKNPTGIGANFKMILPSVARGIEKSQEWLFKYYVPELKNAALLRRMQDAIRHDPTLATNDMKRKVVFNELSRANDNRFGEMFYKGLFINKHIKDISNLSFVSLGWNLGQAREVGGAASQATRAMLRLYKGDTRGPIEKARQEASNHISFVAHYAAITALAAGGLTWALTGKPPSEPMDFVYPKNGEINDDGTDGRLSTSFNTREPVMLKAHIDERNSILGGMAQLIWNKTILQPFASLFTNKDFAGEHVWDTNAGTFKAALQGVDATLGHMFNPISVAGGIRAYQEGGGKKGVALAMGGFGPAPKYANEDKWERRITALYREQAIPEVKPYEYGPKTGLGSGAFQSTVRMAVGDRTQGEARIEYRKAYNHAKQTGNQEDMAKYAKLMGEEGHLAGKTIRDQQKGNIYTYRFARLPAPTQESIAREMSDETFDRYVRHNANAGIKKDTKSRMIKERDGANP